MTINNPLQNWHMVLLRDDTQNQQLRSFITQQGGQATSLPTLTITPISPLDDLATFDKQISQADWIFVASQNAVHCTPVQLLKTLQQTKAKVITMGRATSEALIARGVSVFFTPSPGSSSESLLAEPWLQQNSIAQQKVVLLAGEGGRTLLYETLVARQAKVDWARVYRQVPLPLDLAPLLSAWSLKTERFCFVAMSQNGLMHFLDKMPPTYHAWLKKQAFIVISERIAMAARKWGVQHIFVAKGAHQEQLCASMLHVTQFCHTMT